MTNPIMTEAQAREEAARFMGVAGYDDWSRLAEQSQAFIVGMFRNNFAPLSAIEERDATIARLREALAAEDAYWEAILDLARDFSRIRPQAEDAFNAASARRDRARTALNEGQTP